MNSIHPHCVLTTLTNNKIYKYQNQHLILFLAGKNIPSLLTLLVHRKLVDNAIRKKLSRVRLQEVHCTQTKIPVVLLFSIQIGLIGSPFCTT